MARPYEGGDEMIDRLRKEKEQLTEELRDFKVEALNCSKQRDDLQEQLDIVRYWVGLRCVCVCMCGYRTGVGA